MLENLKIPPAYDGFLFLAESVRNPPALKPHHHAELELNLVVRGQITYVVSERRTSYQQRSLLWMFPSQEHQLVDRTADAQYYVAVFKPAMIADVCRTKRYHGLMRKRLSQEGVLSTELTPTAYDLIRSSMEAVVEDGIDPDVLNREAGFGANSDFTFQHHDPDWLNAGLRHLLLLCWREQQIRVNPQRNVTLHPAVAHSLELMASGEGACNLASLARQCGLSASHLSRLFHEQVGVPLSRYRNSVRLSRFWEHYRHHGKGELLRCVLEAGFGSYAQFYRVFKEAYGKGPRESLS